MSGSCTQDYGSLTIMPMSGALKTDVAARASAFTHENEKATPAYYSVQLKDYQIQAELTAASHAAMLQFRFDRNGEAYIVVEPNSDEGEGFIEVNPVTKEINRL